jgi:hypothetical protein
MQNCPMCRKPSRMSTRRKARGSCVQPLTTATTGEQTSMEHLNPCQQSACPKPQGTAHLATLPTIKCSPLLGKRYVSHSLNSCGLQKNPMHRSLLYLPARQGRLRVWQMRPTWLQLHAQYMLHHSVHCGLFAEMMLHWLPCLETARPFFTLHSLFRSTRPLALLQSCRAHQGAWHLLSQLRKLQ